MLPLEVEELSGLWSNNSSSASLHEYTNVSTPQQHHDYDNPSTSIGLSDITVADILEAYKNDTELLKHILRAKAEEDKRRAAEEIRRTEEARLQSKYLDLGYGQQKRFSDPSTFTDEFLSGSLGSLAVSSAEVIPDWLSFNPDNTINMLSPSPMAVSLSQVDQTPPSPTTSCYRPPSPFPSTSFEVPFADLTISTTSSPEPSDSITKLANGYNSVTTIATASSSSLPSTAYGPIDTDPCQDDTSQYNRYHSLVPPPLPRHDNTIGSTGSETESNSPATKISCKRTLSRTRSQRRPVLLAGKKKNRSIPLPQHDPTEPLVLSTTKHESQQQLDHGTVMEALRAKLRRSSNPPLLSDGDMASVSMNISKSNNTLTWSRNQVDYPPQPMSPQGMLLLDLKNPRKVFPTNNNGKKRSTINPKVAVFRRPKPFTSAHNHCEKLKDAAPIHIK